MLHGTSASASSWRSPREYGSVLSDTCMQSVRHVALATPSWSESEHLCERALIGLISRLWTRSRSESVREERLRLRVPPGKGMRAIAKTASRACFRLTTCEKATFGSLPCVHRPSIAQVPSPPTHPSPFIHYSQRIQVPRHRSRIVHPFSQQWTTIDDIDGELTVLVLVGEIAP